MKTHFTKEFYESLAYLLYAIAAVDGKVRIEEKRRIKILVEQQWLYAIDGTSSQDIIYPALKKIIQSNFDKEQAFLNFKNFFSDHRSSFSEEIKKKIMATANSITMAFSRLNKSESVLLSRLYFLLYENAFSRPHH